LRKVRENLPIDLSQSQSHLDLSHLDLSHLDLSHLDLSHLSHLSMI
jgi:hypothetical protein